MCRIRDFEGRLFAVRDGAIMVRVSWLVIVQHTGLSRIIRQCARSQYALAIWDILDSPLLAPGCTLATVAAAVLAISSISPSRPRSSMVRSIGAGDATRGLRSFPVPNRLSLCGKISRRDGGSLAFSPASTLRCRSSRYCGLERLGCHGCRGS